MRGRRSWLRRRLRQQPPTQRPRFPLTLPTPSARAPSLSHKGRGIRKRFNPATTSAIILLTPARPRIGEKQRANVTTPASDHPPTPVRFERSREAYLRQMFLDFARNERCGGGSAKRMMNLPAHERLKPSRNATASENLRASARTNHLLLSHASAHPQRPRKFPATTPEKRRKFPANSLPARNSLTALRTPFP